MHALYQASGDAVTVSPELSVDLPVQDDIGRILLTWRHDVAYGPGWHIPGGIVRYKERAMDRIQPLASSFWARSFSRLLLTQRFEESLLLFTGQELEEPRDAQQNRIADILVGQHSHV
jgi:hypothetical protein